MASRAFFRCRACGEPVMAGAYRCPVCGIDFPSGTPGAPDRSASAAVPPEREPEPAETVPHDDIIDAEFEHEDTLDFAPGADRGPTGGVRTATADLNVRPREDADRSGSVAATLSVRPARESAPVTVTDVEFEVEEDDDTTQRRGWGKALFGTLVSAVLLIAIVAGSIWWLDARGALPTSGVGTFTVEMSDGWVSLPTEGRALVVEADGPFRLRVAGRVYSMPGDRAVQVPADAEASVRIVRSPTTATISSR